MKIKNKYVIEIAIYQKDAKTCMAGGIFKGDKIIYYTRKQWEVILLIRIIIFSNMKWGYIRWAGTRSSAYQQIIKRHESTN